MISRGIVYFRLASFSVLLGVLFWQDFLALFPSVLEPKYLILVSLVIIMFAVYAYANRRTIGSLLLVSETRGMWAAFLFLIAMILYIEGYYIGHTLLLHLMSLVVFIFALLSIGIDYRIPRLTAIPILSILSLYFITIEETFPGTSSTAQFAIIVLAALIGGKVVQAALQGKKEALGKISPAVPVDSCILHSSVEQIDPVGLFCPHCGRRRTVPQGHSHSHSGTIFVGLIILASLFFSIPALNLSEDDVSISEYSAYGVKDHPFLSTPRNWTLNSHERLESLENQYGDDLLVKNTFVPEVFPETKMYTVFYEISASDPYLVRSFSYIQGWNRTGEISFLFGGKIPAKLITHERFDETLLVIAFIDKFLFNDEGNFKIRNIGVTVQRSYLGRVDQAQVAQNIHEVNQMWQEASGLWVFHNEWNMVLHSIIVSVSTFGDVILSSVAALVILTIIIRAKRRDSDSDKLAEKASTLPNEDLAILAAVSKAESLIHNPTGAEILQYCQKQSYDDLTSLHNFYLKLLDMERKGFLKRMILIKGPVSLMTWKLNF